MNHIAIVDGVKLTEAQVVEAQKQIEALKKAEQYRLKPGVLFKYWAGGSSRVYLVLKFSHNNSVNHPVFEVATFDGGKLTGVDSWADGHNDYTIVGGMQIYTKG